MTNAIIFHQKASKRLDNANNHHITNDNPLHQA